MRNTTIHIANPHCLMSPVIINEAIIRRIRNIRKDYSITKLNQRKLIYECYTFLYVHCTLCGGGGHGWARCPLLTRKFKKEVVVCKKSYSRRMRLQRRLFETHSACFLLFLIPCNLKLVNLTPLQNH